MAISLSGFVDAPMFPDRARAQGSRCVWDAGLRALVPTPVSMWIGGIAFPVFSRLFGPGGGLGDISRAAAFRFSRLFSYILRACAYGRRILGVF